MKSDLRTTNTVFRALADETRLRLLNLLLEGEVCVCDLCEVLVVSQPNISRHLAYLKRAGPATVRQDGKWKYYAVPPEPAPLHKSLLRCVRDCVRGSDVLRDDLVKLQEVRRQDRCS